MTMREFVFGVGPFLIMAFATLIYDWRIRRHNKRVQREKKAQSARRHLASLAASAGQGRVSNGGLQE